ncbi:MAG TPA: 50S ribosomal protein L19e [Candidatus Woesearchaeota archaeon]|nr:MAG: 50S ribosomal protein L19e [Candidatus Woesearchaeota archaeon]HDD70559.1 50S ribosomal protein L19e [Candidatus Woesearchaeota archaeon]
MKLQKKLAARILKSSPRRIRLDSNELEKIKEAITKADVKGLINSGLIKEKQVKGKGNFHSRKKKVQKRKGRQQGHGSRKGKATARSNPKEKWMNKIRAQRGLLKVLKSKGYISNKDFRNLYLKAKGGFFRSKRHIKLFIEEQGLVIKK